MPIETVRLITNSENNYKTMDEAELAAAVITQCWTDIEGFTRRIYRKRVPCVDSKEHRRHLLKEAYRTAWNDCVSAIHFLAHPGRHDDRMFWCQFLEVNPDKLVEDATERYGYLVQRILYAEEPEMENPYLETAWKARRQVLRAKDIKAPHGKGGRKHGWRKKMATGAPDSQDG